MPATMPSRMGSSVRAAAWAMAAEPSPASLEKHARTMPQRNANHTDAPANPPVSAAGVNACLKISAKHAGISLAFVAITYAAARTYTTHNERHELGCDRPDALDPADDDQRYQCRDDHRRAKLGKC